MSTDIEKKEQDEKDKKALQTIEASMPNVSAIATGLQLRSEEDVEGARDLCKIWENNIAFSEAFLRPGIKKANELHKELTGKLKLLQDPFKEAIQIINTDKISPYYDEVERKEEEAADLKAIQDLENSNLRIQAAQNTIDELMQGITDTTEQINVLTVRLHNEELEEEEAAICRSMIETLQNSKVGAQKAAETAIQQTRESAVPDPATIPTTVKTAKGVGKKRYKCVGVNNPKALLQAILDGKVGIGIIKFDLVALSKSKNLGTDIPAATFQTVRTFRKV